MAKSGRGRWIRHAVTAEEAGSTVEEIARERLELSGRMLQRLTRSRGLTLNARPAYLQRAVREGDVVAARVAVEEAATLQPIAMELSILYEDADLLLLDKPPGLLVHPTSASHTRTLAHGIAHHYAEKGIPARVRPVHRLDRDTSGVLIVAKNAFAHQHLDRQLREGSVLREYTAVVEGRVTESGTIAEPVGVSRADRNLREVRSDGEPALTRYQVREVLPEASVLGVTLESGRTHQIRVHLAHLGHPVVGDVRYGARRTRWIGRGALHSSVVRVRQPRSGEAIEVLSPLPADIVRLVDHLRATGGSVEGGTEDQHGGGPQHA